MRIKCKECEIRGEKFCCRSLDSYSVIFHIGDFRLKVAYFAFNQNLKWSTFFYRTNIFIFLLKIKMLSSGNAKLLGVNTKTTKEKIAIIDVTLEVENLDELNKAQRVVRKVDSVYDVKRKK